MAAAQAILSRTTVRSPTDGIVVSAVYNSPGAVVAPGEKVIEILPTSSNLIVEAKLSPHDIDSVHAGQSARLKLTALNTRLTPDVDATVINVSADRLMDENTHEPYYRAKLRITENLPAPVTAEQLYPGMPVEAFISTGDRTFFEYLLRPVLDSFHRAFVEQ
nr:HlyD family efflux transporter periplasmic adaptor subunit [Mesorhizobium sp.]